MFQMGEYQDFKKDFGMVLSCVDILFFLSYVYISKGLFFNRLRAFLLP